MTTPRWQQLIAEPGDLDADGIATAIIADGGDAAYRAALDRWNDLRDGHDRDALAGIALVLSDAFDDHRGVDDIANTWDEPLPEQFAWRAALTEPNRHVQRAFGIPALKAVAEWCEGGQVDALPSAACRALRLLAPDDEGGTYLAARRAIDHAVHERASDDAPLHHAAQLSCDDLLVAAAKATPDAKPVQQTVLSYWGQAKPLDGVPTAEPLPGDPPASWTASCELIGRASSAALVEQLIGLVREEPDVPERSLSEYVTALGRSRLAGADGYLLDLAKSDSPVAGLAVRTLAARRRRLADAEPPNLARFDALAAQLRAQGMLREEPGPRARAAIAQHLANDDDPVTMAVAIAEAYGVPTAGELAPEWAAFATWLEETELPAPTPAPAAPTKPRGRGLFGGLFDRH